MITQVILQNRIKNFWGYGNLESPVWFVGMEERFDYKKEGIEMLEQQFLYADAHTVKNMLNADRSRVSEWKHLANMEPFIPDIKRELQKTWRLPIALYLYLHNSTRPTRNEILKFQRWMLADKSKERVATLELSPLPAPSTNDDDWSLLYSRYRIHGLESRRLYEKSYLPERADKLKELVKEYAPRLIIFYGRAIYLTGE